MYAIRSYYVDVDHHDELLVAASGIIPVFAFPHWEYPSLTEVLLYPDLFNEQYKTGQSDSLISGMVGNGPMTGKVIFSKPALHLGYSNANDKKNVGIHEFVHLIDMADGVIDGVPEVIADKLDTEEWLELMQEKIVITSYSIHYTKLYEIPLWSRQIFDFQLYIVHKQWYCSQ